MQALPGCYTSHMGNQDKPLTPTDIALQVQEARYRQRDAMTAENTALHRRVAELEAELAMVRTRAENLEESLRLIGQAPCFWAGFPSKSPCAEKLADVSEWCWPCYAKAIVEDRGGMARAFERLEAGGPDCDEPTRLMVLTYREALQRQPSDREVDALCWAWQHGIAEGRDKAARLLKGRMEAYATVAKSLHEPAPRGESVHGPIFEAIVEANDQRIAAQRQADHEASRVEQENALADAALAYAECFAAVAEVALVEEAKAQHAALNEAWDRLSEAARVWSTRTPIPITLWCPNGHRHVDKGAFEAKPHHTHSCQVCGITWRPAVVDTVGVLYLPGFKDDEPRPASEPRRHRTPAQKRERRLATLRRRQEWLASKGEAASNFDRAEESALRWALEQLKARVLTYDIVIDVQHTPAFFAALEDKLRALVSDVEVDGGR